MRQARYNQQVYRYESIRRNLFEHGNTFQVQGKIGDNTA